MPRPITELSDAELENLVRNYRAAGRTEGGPYTLADVLLEQLRRKPNPFGTREVAAKIIDLARESADGFLSYGELWKAFRPDTPWTGHSTQQIVRDRLDRVVAYCVQNR